MKTIMATHKTIRVRGAVWDAIEKKAWEFSIKKNRVIKPTDVADALLRKNMDTLTVEEVEEIIKTR